MESFKDTESYTYEHRIIQEARIIVSSLKQDGKLFGIMLAPRTLAVLSMFSKVADMKLPEMPESRGVSGAFLEFFKLVSRLNESSFKDEDISNLSQMISESVNKIAFDEVMLRNLSDVLVLSLLFDEIVNSSLGITATIVNKKILGNFVSKLENLQGRNELYKMFYSLVEYYDVKSIVTVEPIPLKDPVFESLIQLLLAKFLSNNTEHQIILNIKFRRLLYVKQLVEKVNLLDELKEGLLKPSEPLIFNLLFSACILVLLSFKKTISLNYLDTLSYIDSQADTRLVENELLKERKDATSKALTFQYSVVLDKLGIRWNARLKLHQLIPIYFLTWLVTFIIVLIQIFYLRSISLIAITVLLFIYIIASTISITYQAYKKLK